MRTADNIITVRLTEPPSGIFSELSPSLSQRMQTIEARLHGIDAVLQLGKMADELPPMVSAFMGGVQDMVIDCLALTKVQPERIFA